jgi:glc operon protein GlcG
LPGPFFFARLVRLKIRVPEICRVAGQRLIYNPFRSQAWPGSARKHPPAKKPLMKTTQTIDYSEAKKIIDRIVDQALHMKKAAVIAVADSHGELIAFARMDGAPVSSIRIAANKAWTAARERKSTQDIGDRARHPEKGHDIAYYGDPKFVGWGGGIPVWRDGEVVGAVAVSGLSSSEDVVLATLGMELVAGKEKKRR